MESEYLEKPRVLKRKGAQCDGFCPTGCMGQGSTPSPPGPGTWDNGKMGCFTAKESCTFQVGPNMRPPGTMEKW